MLKKPRDLLNLRRQEAALINVLADWRWFMNPYSNEALCTKSTMPSVFFVTKKFGLTMCHLSKSYLKSGTFVALEGREGKIKKETLLTRTTYLTTQLPSFWAFLTSISQSRPKKAPPWDKSKGIVQQALDPQSCQD